MCAELLPWGVYPIAVKYIPHHIATFRHMTYWQIIKNFLYLFNPVRDKRNNLPMRWDMLL